MKKLTIILILGVFVLGILSSCKKNNTPPSYEMTADINGIPFKAKCYVSYNYAGSIIIQGGDVGNSTISIRLKLSNYDTTGIYKLGIAYDIFKYIYDTSVVNGLTVVDTDSLAISENLGNSIEIDSSHVANGYTACSSYFGSVTITQMYPNIVGTFSCTKAIRDSIVTISGQKFNLNDTIPMIITNGSFVAMAPIPD